MNNCNRPVVASFRPSACPERPSGVRDFGLASGVCLHPGMAARVCRKGYILVEERLDLTGMGALALRIPHSFPAVTS